MGLRPAQRDQSPRVFDRAVISLQPAQQEEDRWIFSRAVQLRGRRLPKMPLQMPHQSSAMTSGGRQP